MRFEIEGPNVSITFRRFGSGILAGVFAGLIFNFVSGLIGGSSAVSSGFGESAEGNGRPDDLRRSATLSVQPGVADSTWRLADESESAPPRPPPPTLAPADLLEQWLSWEDLESRLAQEGIDLAWAPRMESLIMEGLATVDLRFIAMGTHCRETMCRIEVLIDNNSGGIASGVIDDAIMPPLKAAMRATYDRWSVPAVKWSTTPLVSPMLSQGPGTPAPVLHWIAYVFDESTTPSNLRQDDPTNRGDIVDERSREAIQRWLEEQGEIVGLDGRAREALEQLGSGRANANGTEE